MCTAVVLIGARISQWRTCATKKRAKKTTRPTSRPRGDTIQGALQVGVQIQLHHALSVYPSHQPRARLCTATSAQASHCARCANNVYCRRIAAVCLSSFVTVGRMRAPSFSVGKPCKPRAQQKRCIAPACRCSDQESFQNLKLKSFCRRFVVLNALFVAGVTASAGADAAQEAGIDDLASRAIDAYNQKMLPEANQLYTKIISLEPNAPVWLERRGQVLVDLKRFDDAIGDFNAAEGLYQRTVDANYVSLGLLSNRALANEGLYRWDAAIADYDKVCSSKHSQPNKSRAPNPCSSALRRQVPIRVCGVLSCLS